MVNARLALLSAAFVAFSVLLMTNACGHQALVGEPTPSLPMHGQSCKFAPFPDFPQRAQAGLVAKDSNRSKSALECFWRSAASVNDPDHQLRGPHPPDSHELPKRRLWRAELADITTERVGLHSANLHDPGAHKGAFSSSWYH